MFYNLYEKYLWALTLADPKSKGWFMVDSPLPTIYCTLIYLFIVWIGPKLMKSRAPFDLKGILIPYNIFLAALNGYIALQFFLGSYRQNYSYTCEPWRRTSVHPEEIRIAKAMWWYYFSKMLDFCDTIFFILRKRDRQITFLHVYHHSTMFPLWWLGIKWTSTGSTFFSPMINSVVHVVMYFYYALTALGPSVTKYLWWKKYITILQLIQFLIALFSSMLVIYVDCDFPMWVHYSIVLYMITLLILFGNFYVKSYTKRKRAGQKSEEAYSVDVEKRYKQN